jgi:ABC-type nitrate/sulfonate/bicarbonate transport system permease component
MKQKKRETLQISKKNKTVALISALLIAVIVFATIPATRYTVEGLNNVPPSLNDAGSMSGVNGIQRWSKIQLPLAFPHMMLGINQTVVFSKIHYFFQNIHNIFSICHKFR